MSTHSTGMVREKGSQTRSDTEPGVQGHWQHSVIDMYVNTINLNIIATYYLHFYFKMKSRAQLTVGLDKDYSHLSSSEPNPFVHLHLQIRWNVPLRSNQRGHLLFVLVPSSLQSTISKIMLASFLFIKKKNTVTRQKMSALRT